MTFNDPRQLLLLLPLAGIIVLLYLLKMKRRDVRIPASFLWPAKTEEIRANSLFQRLRFSWLMVLQLLALTALVGALARPQVLTSGAGGKTTILVLDNSASMSATDVGPSRLEAAKREVGKETEAAKPGDRIALIEAGVTPRIVFPLSSDPARQAAALGSVEGTDSESDPVESLRLAAALAQGVEGAEIVVLSDGAFRPPENFAPGKATVRFRSFGSSAENLSIEALGVSEFAAGPRALVSVRNHGKSPAANAVSILVDGRIVASEKFTIPGGGVFSKTVTLPTTVALVEARLANEDLLSADNRSAAVRDARVKLKVLLVSPGDLFLERALALDPRVQLDRTNRLPDGEAEGYDIVVFDSTPPVAHKAKATLAFLDQPGGRPASDITQSNSDLLTGVDLASTYVGRTANIPVHSGDTVLAKAGAEPILVQREDTGRPEIWVGFSPLQSDFPLSVGFPIFIANSLDALRTKSQTEGPVVVKTGVPFRLDRGEDELQLAPYPAIPIDSKSGLVPGLDHVGDYEAQPSGRKAVIATLSGSPESDIQPKTQLDLGGRAVASEKAGLRFGDFWRPILLVALLILAGEWWLFVRRS